MKPTGCPGIATTENWGGGFDRYLDSPDGMNPLNIDANDAIYLNDLCASQYIAGPLHGDLHHAEHPFRCLDRGWLAISLEG